MKHLELPSGDLMPAVGLGTWKSTPGEVGPAVLEALRLGYRHIDCAWIYGNEFEIGAALKEAFEGGVLKRDELFVTSKLWNNVHESERVRPALEQTLGQLQLEYLDLYLMHWPVALKHDATIPEAPEDFLSLEDVPIADTWSAMEACAEAGLSRNLGVSNFNVRLLEELLTSAAVRPAANQVEMHPHLPQSDLLAFCRGAGVVVTAYSPLGSPDRPPQLMNENEPPLLEHAVIAEIATKHTASPAQVLVAWAVQRGTSVIPKSVNPERMAQNLAAVDLALDAGDMERIASIEGPYRYITGSFWTMEGSPYTLADLWGAP